MIILERKRTEVLSTNCIHNYYLKSIVFKLRSETTRKECETTRDRYESTRNEYETTQVRNNPKRCGANELGRTCFSANGPETH